MRADINLKQKQAFWETPRNLAIIIGTVAALTAAFAGWTGYRIGQAPSQPVFVLPPGTTIMVPAPAPK